MTVQELTEATKHTRDKIWEVKRRLKATCDLKERRALEQRLKELQNLQLWQLDQLDWNTKL